jgi:hypothetical protein
MWIVRKSAKSFKVGDRFEVGTVLGMEAFPEVPHDIREHSPLHGNAHQERRNIS